MGKSKLRFVASAVLAVALAMLVAGCYNYKVYDCAELAPSSTRADVRLFVQESHKVAPSDLEAALIEQLERSRAVAQVVPNDDDGVKQVGGRAYILSVRVRRYEAVPVRRWLGGEPTGSRARTEQTLEFEVALHRTADVPLVEERTSVGVMRHYDVRDTAPFFHQTFSVELEEGHQDDSSGFPRAKRRREHQRHVAEQFAVRMLNASLPSIVAALAGDTT